MQPKLICLRMITFATILSGLSPADANPTFIQWGTSQSDRGSALTVDSAGNAWLAGRIGVNIQDTNDVFLRRYNTNGTLAWARQLGNTAQDTCHDVAVDASGNAYLCGQSLDGLGISGQPQADRLDAFLARYDANGSLAWTRQLGSVGNDICYRVAVDGTGKVYVVGTSQNGLDGAAAGSFLRRYSPNGSLDWTRTFGGTSSAPQAISVDHAGNAYIAGETLGSLDGANAGGLDAFLLRYNPDGTLAWTRQLGTPSQDRARGVALDGAGKLYVAGTTSGSLALTNAGSNDIFVARFDTSGNLAWTRQFGSAGFESCGGVSVDGSGNVYVAGDSDGNLAGVNFGSIDGFLVRYDASGTLHDILPFGSSAIDLCNDVQADNAGNVHLCGSTRGSLGGANAGDYDAYLAKFTVPLPQSGFRLALRIMPNGVAYDFEWSSRPGKLYDLVSSTDLNTPPNTWPVWQTLQNITAAGAGLNSLTSIPGGGEPRRFFAILEKDAP